MPSWAGAGRGGRLQRGERGAPVRHLPRQRARHHRAALPAHVHVLRLLPGVLPPRLLPDEQDSFSTCVLLPRSGLAVSHSRMRGASSAGGVCLLSMRCHVTSHRSCGSRPASAPSAETTSSRCCTSRCTSRGPGPGPPWIQALPSRMLCGTSSCRCFQQRRVRAWRCDAEGACHCVPAADQAGSSSSSKFSGRVH